MAFCTQCGSAVGDQDLYCSNCGLPQRPPASRPTPKAPWPPSGASSTQSSFAPRDPFPPMPPFPPPPYSAPPPPPPPGVGGRPHWEREFMAGWPDSKVAAMCYIPVVGWIFAIVVLAADRFRTAREARFHAFQGLYLFVMWLVIDWVFGPLSRNNQVTHNLSDLIQLVLFGTGIFMLIKTRQGELIRLPVIGELAEKSVSEQK